MCTTLCNPKKGERKDVDIKENVSEFYIDAQRSLEKCTRCDQYIKKKNIFFIPLEGKCLSKTIRHMRYRAFLKWYYGAHRQEWGRLAVISLLLISGAVTSFGYHVYSQGGYWWKSYGVAFFVIFAILSLAFFFFFVPLFVGRWSVRISLIYICMSVVSFISILTNRIKAPVINLADSFGMTGVELLEGEKKEGLIVPKTLFLFISLSFFAFQMLNFIFGIIYSTMVKRLARYYYLKSSFFISTWVLCSVEPVQLLVPSLAIMERQRYVDALKEKNDPINVTTVTSHSPHHPSHPPHSQQHDMSKRLSTMTKSHLSSEPLSISSGFRIECCRKEHCFDVWSLLSCWRSITIFSRLLYCCRCFFFQKLCSTGERYKKSRIPYPYKKRKFHRCVVFIGETNQYGEPSGFGSWSDDGDSYGERLIGYWRQGLPDGPHKSREAGTGSGFMCIRIGWCKYVLADDVLSFGISNVECSVSGKFYKHYPLVTLEEPPSSCVEVDSSSGVQNFETQTLNESKEEKNKCTECFAPPVQLSLSDATTTPLVARSVPTLIQMKQDLVKRNPNDVELFVSSAPNSPQKSKQNSLGHVNSRAHSEDKSKSVFLSKSNVVLNTTESTQADPHMNFFGTSQHETHFLTQDEPKPSCSEHSINVQEKEHSTQQPNREKKKKTLKEKRTQDETKNQTESVTMSECDSSEKESGREGGEGMRRKIGKAVLRGPSQAVSKKAATLANATRFRRRRQRSLSLLPWYYKTQRHVMWCLMKLCPPTPNFGVQSRCELIIGVDWERGVYIGGYTSLKNYEIKDKEKLEETSRDSSLLGNFNTFSLSHLSDGNDQSLPVDREFSLQSNPLNHKRPILDILGEQKKKSKIVQNQTSHFYSVHGRDSLTQPLENVVVSVVQRPFICSEKRDFLTPQTDTSMGMKKKAECLQNLRSFCRCPNLPTDIPLFDIKLDTSVSQHSLNHSKLKLTHDYTKPDISREFSLHNQETHSKAYLSFLSQPDPVYRPNPISSKLDPWDSRFQNLIPMLEPEGWVCLDTVGSAEVLLYIHGFNNSQIESLQVLGQMATFGNFPNHIRLFLFSWPAGSSVWQFFSAFRAAENPKTHAALYNMLNLLSDSGIQGVHILCHSMGTRLFLRSFSSICRLFRRVGRDQESCEADGPPINVSSRMQLLTVTFLNPEYYLDDFVQKDYSMLRQYCNHITIFADAKDKALMWFERFSGRIALGKTVFGIWAPSSLSSKASELFPLTNKPPLHFLNTISFFHFSSVVESALGEDGRDLNDEDIEWLDVDVIDTTFMDQNVHNLRHSFWSLNREIIEDIRELMITRKRARQRTGRLDRRDGNVWVYRVAPAFLTSLFEMSI